MVDVGEIQAKREAAARARRIAAMLNSEEDRARILAFAAELEAQAVALEAAQIVDAPSEAAPVQQPQPQPQTQMQMQQAQDSPKKPEDPKS